jgi:hypothetical protein
MSDIVDIVNGAAKARGEPPLSSESIEEAVDRVESGIADCDRYPTGAPCLKGLYEIAKELE